MKKLKWWTMYFETQRLKKLGLKLSQIARALSLSRNTVYRYLGMNPEDLEQERERRNQPITKTPAVWIKRVNHGASKKTTLIKRQSFRLFTWR